MKSEKKKIYMREYAAKHKEERIAYMRAWRDANKESVAELNRLWRAKNAERVTANHRAYYEANKGKYASWARVRNTQVRAEVLSAYGGKCQCCGETQPEFLSIDHVNNDGAKHRLEVGNGASMYLWLKKKGFPKDGFQLLCFNCNLAKEFSGGCPHEKNRPAKVMFGRGCTVESIELLK